MADVFNNLSTQKLDEFNNIFPLNKEELSLFKKAGRFSKKIIKNRHRLSSQIENSINDYEALSYYCQHGTNPWWFSSTAEFKPKKILYNLFIDDYELFFQFIQSIKSDDVVMKRLIQLFDKSDLFSLYNNINPKDRFLSYFQLLIEEKYYKLLLMNWLSHPFCVKMIVEDIKFENWLIAICSNNLQLSGFMCSTLKKIIAKIKNDDREKSLFQRVHNTLNKLMASSA